MLSVNSEKLCNRQPNYALFTPRIKCKARIEARIDACLAFQLSAFLCCCVGGDSVRRGKVHDRMSVWISACFCVYENVAHTHGRILPFLYLLGMSMHGGRRRNSRASAHQEPVKTAYPWAARIHTTRPCSRFAQISCPCTVGSYVVIRMSMCRASRAGCFRCLLGLVFSIHVL
jgi:hypothetical protein